MCGGLNGIHAMQARYSVRNIICTVLSLIADCRVCGTVLRQYRVRLYYTAYCECDILYTAYDTRVVGVNYLPYMYMCGAVRLYSTTSVQLKIANREHLAPGCAWSWAPGGMIGPMSGLHSHVVSLTRLHVL